jgi:alginate O-acetyltransferase complex protein AlgJ
VSTQRSHILAIGFATLLLLPTLDQLFGFSDRFKSTETRRVTAMPGLSLRQVKTVARQFDQHYKESFGGRNALVYAYSNWKYRLMKQSPLPDRVVVGKNGWFFVGDHYNNAIKQHRGLLPLPADTAQAIAERLIRCQQQLAQQGIKLYVLIAPDSHSIYPEYLPDNLSPLAVYAPVDQLSTPEKNQHKKGDKSPLDVLSHTLSQYKELPFLDLRDTLWRAKKKHQVYQQTDTHWNSYGALVGCAALIKRIRQDFPQLRPVQTADYHIESMRGRGGDLVTLFMLQDELRDTLFYDIRLRDSQLYPIKADTTINPDTGLPAYHFVGADQRQPRLLFLGDSFSLNMINYIAPYFSASYFGRGHVLNPETVRAEKPDVVVIEIVERNLRWLRNL